MNPSMIRPIQHPHRSLRLGLALGMLVVLTGLLLPATAQEDAPAEDASLERRVITIDSSGGTQSGNLRYGPIVYEHPEPFGITATVSTLTILGPRAELSGPTDTLLTQAKGSRTAVFDGGVRVVRDQLEAEGPSLIYEEATGLGVINGGSSVRIAPDDEEGDVTYIDADSVEFDVDTDRSVNRGSVSLETGTQRATSDELEYDESKALAVLSCSDDLCSITREDDVDGVLVITAKEIRVLPQAERLWARGSVTVIDGDLVTRGDEAIYDDENKLAEITGSPAISVNEVDGVTLESDRILQDIEFDYVEAIDASQASDVDLDAFLFEEELGAGGSASP